MRSLGETPSEQLESDLRKLNLKLYVTEVSLLRQCHRPSCMCCQIVDALVEAKLAKKEDVRKAVLVPLIFGVYCCASYRQVASLMHQRYASFTSELLPKLMSHFQSPHFPKVVANAPCPTIAAPQRSKSSSTPTAEEASADREAQVCVAWRDAPAAARAGDRGAGL